ncbi:MAG TPA: ABC transporter permease [Methylomirabilota bacterium]|nr:ABC transporter permease [Methylomirabilota bacterium]
MNHAIRVVAFTKKNWINTRRNIFTIFEIVFWPAVGVLSVGLLTRFLELTPETSTFVLIGTLALSLVQICQLDVAYAILFDMWGKSAKHQFLAPISPWHMVLGSWLMGVIRGLVVFGLLAGVARLAFGFDFFAPGPVAVAIFLLGMFLTAGAIGISVCVLLLLFGLRAEVSAWSGVSLVLLLCGIYYPVTLLPEPFMTLAAWIPLTHFLEAFREHFGFSPVFQSPLLKGFLSVGAYLALSYWGLTAAIKRARRNGLLLRLSE